MTAALRPWLRPLLGGLAFGLLVLALVTVRAVTEGERQLTEADAAIRRQEWVEAAARARAAASWYVPGAPHVPAAYARLLHVARTAEASGQREAALFAWRAMRSAAEQTAWLLQPHQFQIDLANRAIARLAAHEPRPLLAPEDTDALAERRMQALLARRDAPRGGGVGLVVLGLVASVLGLVGVGLRGLSPEGRWRWHQARWPALLALVGLTLYALALWFA